MNIPSVCFKTELLESWLEEDLGIFDLSSTVLGVGEQEAKIAWVAREPMIVACTEEVARMVRQYGGEVLHYIPSGQRVEPNAELVVAHGKAQVLLDCWKVAQNLLEYACSVATRAEKIVNTAQLVKPGIAILTTRKHPPGLRRVAQKAAMAGGAFPHRLGLSETVLIFPQHRALIAGGWVDLRSILNKQRHYLIEKKIVIEANSYEEACEAARSGADIVQFDKVEPPELSSWCSSLRKEWPNLSLLAAGGINQDNVADYANSGVDALVTSSLYFGPPADIGVNIQPIESSQIK